MQRDYDFLEATIGLCPECLSRLDAKIIGRNGSVYISRHCPEHGAQLDLLEEDREYFSLRNQFANRASVSSTQTESRNLCPFDCGLCPNHEQHTCIALLEITEACQLNCPVCYAASTDGNGLSAVDFERMLDFTLESEGGTLDILQLSGGEPTLHPDLIQFIRIARTKGIKFVLLNTNGLQFASDPGLVESLAEFQEGFEVYLQFDGLSDAGNEQLRGRPLRQLKQQALDALSQHRIPTTLVMSVAAGVNDDEIGATVVHAAQTPFVRGVSLQPLAYFGRLPRNHIERLNRVTLSGVIRRLERQTKQIIRKEHLVPLPCDVDRVAVAYFSKGTNAALTPMTARDQVCSNLKSIKNTLRFSAEDMLPSLSGGACSGSSCCGALGASLQRFFPSSFFTARTAAEKARFVSENTFRITITSFLDAYNFDLRSCQRECVHVITPDLKKVPFSAYNLCHRLKGAVA